MESNQKKVKPVSKKMYNILIITSIGVTIWLIYIIIGVYSFFYKKIYNKA